jgi:hypothetical protein
MPGDPKECRERAKRCMELAAATDNAALKQSLLDLANKWTRLADDLEATRRMLDALGKSKEPGDGSDRPQ